MSFKFKNVAEPEDFRAKFQIWIEACQKLRTAYFEKHYPALFTLTRYDLEIEEGARYIRIVAKEYSRQTGEYIGGSAWAFIDKSNGDVLKASGFKSPAKGARGNLFDEHNGMARIGHNGPAYNR